MKQIIPMVSWVAVLLMMPAYSHHSPASLFVLSEHASIEGIVTEYRLGNPHARVYLTVTNETGEEEQWMAEGGSRTVLIRKGWTGDEVKVGEFVRIVGNPSRDGSQILHWETIFLPDGTELFGEDVDYSAIDERRRRSTTEPAE
jgi:hypothetical protein